MRLLGPVYPHLYVGPTVCEAVVFWVARGESWSSCRRPTEDLQTPGGLKTPSLGRPKWALLVLRQPKESWDDPRSPETTQRSPQTTQRGTDRPGSTPMGPTRHAEDLQTPSLGRPKWVLLVLRRPRGVLRRPKGVLRRPKGVLIVQSRPQWILLVMQTTCRA